MGRTLQKSRSGKFRRWIKRKWRRQDECRFSDESEGEEEDSLDDVSDASFEISRCILNNEIKIFVGTWNVAGQSPVGSLPVDVDDWLNLKDAADIYVLGFQEIVPLVTRNVIGREDPTEAKNWNMLIGKTLNEKSGGSWLPPKLDPTAEETQQYFAVSNRRKSFGGFSTVKRRKQQENGGGENAYKLLASQKIVGVFISVWMKTELLRKYCISDVRVCSVGCGIMGHLGNKGSVSVSMSIEGTSFCFVTAHLASGEKKGDEGKRNHQVSEIFRRTSFPHSSKDGNNHHPVTILGHDRIFWFGDLNYRLYLEDGLARHLIKKQDWKGLQEYDQLQRELEEGGVFQGWQEGNLEFAPTYKYSSSNRNRYSGTLPSQTGEKQRTPAWCDRILWYGKGVKQLSYFRSESKFSDHRPVSALFSMQIEVSKATNPAIHPIKSFSAIKFQEGPSEFDTTAKFTSLSLMERAEKRHQQKEKTIGRTEDRMYAA